MNELPMPLAARRERLITQAAAQRNALAQNIEPWRLSLARIDRGLAVLQTVRRNPAWIVGGVLLLAALRPSRVAIWLRRGWIAWQMLRGLRSR